MIPAIGVAIRSEPVVKCPSCGGAIALSSGWGPVGDKRFRCPQCGENSELHVNA